MEEHDWANVDGSRGASYLVALLQNLNSEGEGAAGGQEGSTTNGGGAKIHITHRTTQTHQTATKRQPLQMADSEGQSNKGSRGDTADLENIFKGTSLRADWSVLKHDFLMIYIVAYIDQC